MVFVVRLCLFRCLKDFIQVKQRIVILAKDKRLSDEYAITYDQVKEAYPDINWGGRS